MRRALTTLNMAALAPTPSAIVSSPTAAKPRFFRSMRTASRMSARRALIIDSSSTQNALTRRWQTARRQRRFVKADFINHLRQPTASHAAAARSFPNENGPTTGQTLSACLSQVTLNFRQLEQDDGF